MADTAAGAGTRNGGGDSTFTVLVAAFALAGRRRLLLPPAG
ncbi:MULTISPECIES: hypothetical protein [unclassified Streptomyces]